MKNKAIPFLLRSLRHPHSQRSMSKILKLSHDQYNKWESCKSRLKWKHLYTICLNRKKNLRAICLDLFCYHDNIEDGAQLFKHILQMNGISVVEAASILKKTPAAIERIVDGTTVLHLDTFLEILMLGTDLSWEFINALSGSTEAYQTKPSHKKPAYSDPFFTLVSAAIRTRKYIDHPKPNDRILLDILGLPISTLEPLIELMLQERIIERKDKKLFSSRDYTDHSGDFKRSAFLAKFWTEFAVSRFIGKDGIPLPSSDSSNGLGHRTVALSKKANHQIQKAFLNFWGQVSTIIKRDVQEHKDVIKVLLFHYFDPVDILKANKKICKTRASAD